MARQRKENNVKIKLRQPDRSGPGPSEETLLSMAEKRGLLKTPDAGLKDENLDEPVIGRLAESILWTITLTMLHFTLDVLVTHQYAVELSWPVIVKRSAQAFPIIMLLFYSFHPHPSPSLLLPRLPPRIQPLLHQLLFFVTSVSAGCYLIHVSNTYGYYAVMKQAPGLGCLWIWSVIELDLLGAAASLLCCIGFLKLGGYSYL
ncbi:hypothetical protein OIDMADRAFT_157612 [Oidiodendron maius Zn]|uniref:DUF7719 domain-containing protein n=1 Tax=Oidiodendron maius (strain Zn) TaxID=913774 RepID=A0A0C3HPT6_OIDMZ|nr:hypothetical protein OIDMADRAFT_157612 [Oidiodendron maius Zn]